MAVMVEQRSFRPFKSSEEYLYAMKEDLAEWLNSLYPDLYINVNNFMDRLDTGVALCKHANNVRLYAEAYVNRRQAAGKLSVHSIATSVLKLKPVHFLPGAKAGTFFARDNVSNFITWCRHGLGVFECLLFETDDLIMRKNEKNVILCLLDVARRAAKLGMPAPMLVHLEREIDREIAAEKRKLKFGGHQEGYFNNGSDEESDLTDSEDGVEYGPLPQIVTNDLKSLDEMVRDEVEKCQCPTQFPMIRVSEGKYRIGDTKVLIFVRVLRSHVMVRVGGGWDTLSHYLDKHDPCRCRAGHRSAISSKLVGIKSGGPTLELTNAQVHYDRSPPRTRRSSTSSNSSGTSTAINCLYAGKPTCRSKSPQTLSPANSLDRRSRSPTPRLKKSLSANRSRSPTPSSLNRSRPGTPTIKRQQGSSVERDKQSKLSRIRTSSPYLRSRSPSGTRYSRPPSPLPRASRSVDDTENKSRPNSPAYKDVEEPPSPKVQATSQEIRSGVDYSPTHRVSDNFKGTSQYHLLLTASDVAAERSTSPSSLREFSGVDTTPACKVSENFELPSPLVPVRKGVSVNELDNIVTKKVDLTDSGSEVSDEGYRSLGLASTPPGNSQSTVPQLNGSPSRSGRPPRSRSAGGQETTRPQQQSPFRRNAKANLSARQSPTHRAQQPVTHHSRNVNYNTWNSGMTKMGKKKRPQISEDTFCQQVAEIMEQYAALMPNPRKDTRSDARISTRIPAPVQQRT